MFGRVMITRKRVSQRQPGSLELEGLPSWESGTTRIFIQSHQRELAHSTHYVPSPHLSQLRCSNLVQTLTFSKGRRIFTARTEERVGVIPYLFELVRFCSSELRNGAAAMDAPGKGKREVCFESHE